MRHSVYEWDYLNTFDSFVPYKAKIWNNKSKTIQNYMVLIVNGNRAILPNPVLDFGVHSSISACQYKY